MLCISDVDTLNDLTALFQSALEEKTNLKNEVGEFENEVSVVTC